MYGDAADPSDEEDEDSTTRSAHKSTSSRMGPESRNRTVDKPSTPAASSLKSPTNRDIKSAASPRLIIPSKTAIETIDADNKLNESTQLVPCAEASKDFASTPHRQKAFAEPAGTKSTILHAPLPPNYCDAGNNDKNHLSISCHLFPRLSETNLQFHDISWNYENFDNDCQRAILRKRMVKVCVMLKIFSIRCEKRITNIDPNMAFDVTLCLVDGRPRADNQIVSNLHTVILPLQTTRIGFLAKPSSTIVIRSNYAQPEVRLRIMVKRRDLTSGDDRSILGSVELPLLDDEQQPAWRTNTLQTRSHLFNEFRMNFELCEFPSRQTQMQAENICKMCFLRSVLRILRAICFSYLPDVIICDESWVGMLACYRQMLCQIISHNRENPPHSTMINDMVLVTFPRIFKNRAIVNAFVRLLVKERLLTSSGDLAVGSQPISVRNIDKFRQLYHNCILPLLISTIDRQSEPVVQRMVDLMAAGDPLAVIGEQRCAPLAPTDYTLHLAGSHALD